MVGTLFSVLIAIFLFVEPLSFQEINIPSFGIILFGVSTIFFLAQILIFLFMWGPLQKTEQTTLPRLIQTFQYDATIRYCRLFFIFFLLVSYLITIDSLFLGNFSMRVLLASWTLLLGIAVDALYYLYKRAMGYLNPFEGIENYYLHAFQSIQRGKEDEICDWIDALAETAIKAMSKHSLALSFLAVDKLQLIAKDYLGIAKTFTYTSNISSSSDKIGYLLFYLFQRYEYLFDKAISQKLELLCGNVISSLGKITIYAAKYDMSIAPYPLHYLTQLAKRAQNEGMQEVSNRAMLTMLEVSKTIIKEVDLQYVEIKEPFINMIRSMHELAKETFRKDKSLSIQLLTQPFYDLKGVFNEGKIATHQDQPVILQTIDQVLDEFATLQTVLSTMPPISEILTPPTSQ
jgi:hypothetical protein